jgi:phosphoinositide-3-kinase regulatory subunit 4
MGQGFSLQALSAGPGGIDVPELSDLTYEKSMGSARFMKSIRARHEDGVVLVKVVVKPYVMKLDKYRKRIIGTFQQIPSITYRANQNLQRNEQRLRIYRML